MGALNNGVTERCGRVRGVIHEMWIVDKSEHPGVKDLKVVGGGGLQVRLECGGCLPCGTRHQTFYVSRAFVRPVWHDERDKTGEGGFFMLGGVCGKRFPPPLYQITKHFSILNVWRTQNRKSASRLGAAIHEISVERLRVIKNAPGTAVHNSNRTTELAVQ